MTTTCGSWQFARLRQRKNLLLLLLQAAREVRNCRHGHIWQKEKVLLQVVVREQALEVPSKTPATFVLVSHSKLHHLWACRPFLDHFGHVPKTSLNLQKRRVQTKYVRCSSVQHLPQVFCMPSEDPRSAKPLSFAIRSVKGCGLTGNGWILHRSQVHSQMQWTLHQSCSPTTSCFARLQLSITVSSLWSGSSMRRFENHFIYYLFIDETAVTYCCTVSQGLDPASDRESLLQHAEA